MPIVGAYGYDAPTTPNIDALAEDAVRFERMYVANSPCLPSRAALLSGRYGINNGVATHGKEGQVLRSPRSWNDWLSTWSEDWTKEGRDALAETTGESAEWLTLPEVFFHERIRTAAVSSFPRHPAPWFFYLWHEFYQPQEPDMAGEYMQTPRAEEVADLALDFLDQNVDDDFFLYAQFWEPHLPYNRDEGEVDRFRNGPLPPHPTDEQIATHAEWTPSSAAHMGVTDRDNLGELLANYDAEIRHVDHHVGRLFERLRDAGVYDETMIVVTADHGEEFGEHGLYSQHGSTHDGTQRVPLLVKPPANAEYESGVRDHLVTNIDMAPTLTDYAGLDAPASWQGRSLRPVLETSEADWRDHIVVDHGLMTAQRAIRTDRWKLIRTYNPGLFGEYIPDRQLYDMQADPWEQEDLADDHPEIVAQLEERMAVWAERRVGRYEDALHAVARTGPTHARMEYWEQARN